MDLSESVVDGAFAALMLVIFELSIRPFILMLLGDYEDYDGELRPLGCTYPNQRRFLITKLLIGCCFIASFVATMGIGASEHLNLAIMSLALFVLYCIVSTWAHLRAFRYFAANHLKPRERGGYRGR
jgi:hypothetical protein